MIAMRPRARGSSAEIARKIVVLPAPLGPRMQTSSPGSTLSETSRSIATTP